MSFGRWTYGPEAVMCISVDECKYKAHCYVVPVYLSVRTHCYVVPCISLCNHTEFTECKVYAMFLVKQPVNYVKNFTKTPLVVNFTAGAIYELVGYFHWRLFVNNSISS